MDLDAMFCLMHAEVLEGAAPLVKLIEDFGDVAGEEDVAGITKVHDPLGYVDAPAHYVDLVFDVRMKSYWSHVDAHADVNVAVRLQDSGKVQRASDGGDRVPQKHERHAVSGRQ